MFDELIIILESFLGPIQGGDGSQYQADCPACSDDNNGPDGKKNLEINTLHGKFRCWKCEYTNEMSGQISTLIKRYGNDEILRQYRAEIKNIKKSKEYELNFEQGDFIFEDGIDLTVHFPERIFSFLFDGNKRESKPLTYLLSRGINQSMIVKYDLKYTDGFCPNKSFRNRIIIPSYDKYGELNYYTGRDYTETSVRKYFNLENSNRKDLIFNEKFINWDGDVVLVEGPVDHLVVPNSVPLLGKSINSDYYLFECIMKKSNQKIIIFLDDDAMPDAINICKKFSCYDLCNRLYIVPTKKLLESLNEGIEDPNLILKKLDPGKLFELYGHRGIAWAIKLAEKYDCI